MKSLLLIEEDEADMIAASCFAFCYIIGIILQSSSAESNDDHLDIINPYQFRVIQDTEPCRAEHKLLVVVHSSPKLVYRRRRMLMRSSWLQPENLEKLLGVRAKIIFVLGSGENGTDRYIKYESEMYGDIVQSDFIDSYRNNTYKAMSFLKWTAESCSNASVLLKIDDDVLLRKDKFEKLKKVIDDCVWTRAPFYYGKEMDRRPHRVRDDKWYVAREESPDRYFPLFFQGLVIFLSPSISGKLYRQALRTNYLFMDDVFIGILIDKLQKSKEEDFNTDVHITKLKDLTSAPIFIEDLEKSWVDSGGAALYHVPFFKQFWEWHSLQRETG